MEKFFEKLEANKTSVTKDIAARLMRITENGFMNERRSIDFMVIKLIIPRMGMGKYGEILANFIVFEDSKKLRGVIQFAIKKSRTFPGRCT